jgi:murein DD-endopeptidase MepM/ murein hydrolase activator NlpD
LASLQSQRLHRPLIDLGDEEPLYTRNISNGPPDRRRVSLRWLAASVLTGIFSVALVGGALQAAIGLDDYSVVRPALAHGIAFGDSAAAEKSDRFRPVPEAKVSRQVIQVSTVTREEDRNIVRVRPFAHVHANLAAPVEADVAARIPPYQAAEIFIVAEGASGAPGAASGDAVADGGDQPPMDSAASDSIYGAEVDGEVEIKTVDFPISGVAYDETAALEPAEIETRVREQAPFLGEGAVEVASLPYVDPARFDPAGAANGAMNALAIAIAPENVSLLAKTDELDDTGIEDKVLPVTEGASLRKMLMDEGADPNAAAAIQSALVANFSFDFRAGQKVRVGLAPDPETGSIRPVRISLYEPNDRHIATVALSDNGLYVAAQEPVSDGELEVAEQAAADLPGTLPTLHDGLWGTGFALGMSQDVIKNLVHIFSYDVDYQTRLSASDNLEVIYSTENANGSGAGEASEILYAALSVGDVMHRFYRFRDSTDGSVDYYDEAGKSAQKFLVRKPVASGRFSSGFGMRRHPIVRRYRMHTGVDYAAPSGTRIMAAGNGVIEKIGTRAGYGRSITVQHLHGYETTYNHLSGYAKGLKAGQKVAQGQVIGFVGSTGLSTGPHLHFEVLVNNRFVDPLKIRVPRGRELQGTELAAFEQERVRIDDLLQRDDERYTAQN